MERFTMEVQKCKLKSEFKKMVKNLDEYRLYNGCMLWCVS